MPPDHKLIFQTAPLLILVLSPDLKVIDATDAYLAATLKIREAIVDRLVYDVFPDNPDDPNPQGVANLKASFNRVLKNKVPDAMGELKYDIPGEDGTFETRYWTTMNTPVLDAEGNITHIINHVMDITDYAVLREKGKQTEQLTNELREKAANMEGEVYLRVKQLQAANEKMSMANEELRATQEELQVTNEELQATHEELRVQQEELMELNTELTHNNEALEKTSLALVLKTEELEQSNSFKTDFLSNMSHELRTPLNSMLILSKLLSDNAQKNLTDKQVEHASIIHKAGNDLLTLINDILDLSKIEAGKVEMVVEKTHVKNIVDNISNMFSLTASQKEIRFNATIDGSVPESLLTDQFRLEQILKNLLSNAFKFTQKDGQVTLSISLQPGIPRYKQSALLSDGGSYVRFAISDTGIGIPLDKQATIFEAFKQADSSTSRKYGGTGLGLSISKQLAALLGGEIQLESEEGKGSTFYIYLPAGNTAAPVPGNGPQAQPEPVPTITKFVTIKHNTIPAEASEQTKAMLKDKVILIVDDDERNLIALQMVLENYGPTLLTAQDGVEALEILTENPNTDLVLIDVMMPGMDGYETIKRIRLENQYKKLPIIVLTAKAMKSDLEKCLSVGASDYLSKPVDVQLLLSMMEIWLSKQGANTMTN